MNITTGTSSCHSTGEYHPGCLHVGTIRVGHETKYIGSRRKLDSRGSRRSSSGMGKGTYIRHEHASWVIPKESGIEQIKEGCENRNDVGSVLRYHRWNLMDSLLLQNEWGSFMRSTCTKPERFFLFVFLTLWLFDDTIFHHLLRQRWLFLLWSHGWWHQWLTSPSLLFRLFHFVHNVPDGMGETMETLSPKILCCLDQISCHDLIDAILWICSIPEIRPNRHGPVDNGSFCRV